MAAKPLPEGVSSRGILVVDDSRLQCAAAADILHALGVSRLEQAYDGAHALATLDRMQPPPAIVMVDLEMPRMDGVELIHHIATRTVPPAIIVASSRERSLIDSVAGMIRKLGLSLLGALSKPVVPGELEQALHRYNQAQSGSQATAPPTPPPQFSHDELWHAILRQEIVPFVQAQATLKQGIIHSVEALARWRQSDGRFVEPGRFLAAIEQHGLMADMTLCILDQVLAAIQSWEARGVRLSVAINLSPSSLTDMHLADKLISQVSEAGVAPDRLVFEVTESSMTEDIASVMASLLRLRLRGFELSIDDYGTGFSSMEQLSRLPFTELKIDRAFVGTANEEPRLRTILESAIEMGTRLGMRTIAEGVETAEMWHLLRRLGCDIGQGYLIARPMPIKEFASRLVAMHQNLRTLPAEGGRSQGQR